MRLDEDFHKEGKLNSLTIEIQFNFTEQAKTLVLIQHLVSIMPKYLPTSYNREVSITSINEPEALIIKEPGEDEPFVHIYGY